MCLLPGTNVECYFRLIKRKGQPAPADCPHYTLNRQSLCFLEEKHQFPESLENLRTSRIITRFLLKHPYAGRI